MSFASSNTGDEDCRRDGGFDAVESIVESHGSDWCLLGGSVVNRRLGGKGGCNGSCGRFGNSFVSLADEEEEESLSEESEKEFVCCWNRRPIEVARCNCLGDVGIACGGASVPSKVISSLS